MLHPFSMTGILFTALASAAATVATPAPSPLSPFVPDSHTRLLYHSDEKDGTIARDASGHGLDGELRNCRRLPGRFGGGLEFNGHNSCVFRKDTTALCGMKRLTVECWFAQDDPSGRQFLVGLDVGFHFDISNGAGVSLSIYNRGGQVRNADGLPHQQVGASVGPIRVGRWHHLAATYDGTVVSFFLDGVLADRVPAARDFLLGAPCRGLWGGCYINREFWYHGRMDEVRVSDVVRYDPERKLKKGQRLFTVSTTPKYVKRVRAPETHGRGTLDVILEKRYGGNGDGWVCLKPPGKPAAIVGRYTLDGLKNGRRRTFTFDVSDETQAPGRYLLGLDPEENDGHFAVREVRLRTTGLPATVWRGECRSRHTFHPPLLVPLVLGPTAGSAVPARIVRTPHDMDRRQGVEIEATGNSAPAVLWGRGYAEFWLDLPATAAWRVSLCYAAAAPMPCDLVIDGDDLHPFNMAARNRTTGPGARNAFWEYQGAVELDAGPHWVRLQDVLPDVVALRLDRTDQVPAYREPWARYPVPAPDFPTHLDSWQVQPEFGTPREATVKNETTNAGAPALHFTTVFANTDPDVLFAGDRVRFVHSFEADLEPFGRCRFMFEGQGRGHGVMIGLTDAKGDEKRLWIHRDDTPGRQMVSVPISFEGNDVFDPGRITALWVALDEGNITPNRRDRMSVRLSDWRFERRDSVVPPTGWTARTAAARTRASGLRSSHGERLVSPGFRPWTRPVVPEDHPLFATTEPKPVTRKTLGDDLHFTGARSMRSETLNDFHRFYDFGDVCWPHIGMLPLRKNFDSEAAWRKALDSLAERLEDVRRRGLFLFDIWGYVPDNPRFPWTVAPEHHAVLLRVLGDRFLGYDNGEQDGRYIGGYADRGKFTTRKGGWADFVRWDKRICADSMNFMNATGSLNFSHYYGERGCRTLGLETAQGLPSDTLMFAFLRGAGKQYGRLTTQATSVWNRFGYNIYTRRKTTGAHGYGYGPHKGCSLSLHKRLLLSSYLGGDSIVGTETAQFTADRLENGAPELSPLGRQHLRIRNWVRKHPQRGVMFTPVAFLLDFYSGWTIPRHLYRGDKYKVWGKLSYNRGDYLADQVFRMAWPGYEDCSYLRNERGFITPTPFGDIFDVLTSRCHPGILRQYTAVMLLGGVEMTPKVVENLLGFVRNGGDLILEVSQARKFSDDVLRISQGGKRDGCCSVLIADGEVFDELPYTFEDVRIEGAEPLLVDEGGRPLVVAKTVGKGRMIVGTVDHWMTTRLSYASPELVNMEPPYRLLRGVRKLLSGYFDSFSPVQVAPAGLTVRTCCFADDPKHLLVGLMNNNLFAEWRGTVSVRTGKVAAVHDIWAERDLQTKPELQVVIGPGDVAILDVRLR